MRYAASASAGTLVWASLLVWLWQTQYSLASTSDENPLTSKGLDDTNPQAESGISKREWNRNLHMWGKRAWQSLQGGWGKRESLPWNNQPYNDKRAWQNLQGAWGKRVAPDDENAMKQLIALMEQEEQEPQYTDYGSDLDTNDDEKRAWKALNGGWGKRADNWNNFRGSWGKRDPAWTNLKGIWGKRAYPRVTQ